MNAIRKWTKRQLVALDCVHLLPGNPWNEYEPFHCAIPNGVEDRRCPLLSPTPKEVREGRDCCRATSYYKYKERNVKRQGD